MVVRLAPLAVAAAFLSLSVSACQRANPAFDPGYVPPETGDAGGGASDASDGSDDGNGGGVEGGVIDTPPVATCLVGDDCKAKLGNPPCGTWLCLADACRVLCPGCGDQDMDGYGAGAACAGPDCDDRDDRIADDAARDCYGGPVGTKGRGTCRGGREICTAGVWTACSGDVTPSGEACNNEDDDCDGSTDEDLGMFTCGVGACQRTAAACTGGAVGVCTPAPSPSPLPVPADGCDTIDNDCDGAVDEDCLASCVYVSPTGDDGTSDPTVKPFRTIQAAINWSRADAGRPKNVCVAFGIDCVTSGPFSFGGGGVAAPGITMANGVSVYGNYESTTWTRCPLLSSGALVTKTVIATGTATGVLFPSSVTAPTILDGFKINRGSSGGVNSTVAAVTVDGAKKVVLSNILVEDLPSSPNTYGINMLNGAEATITSVAISAGNGTAEAVGIRSLSSRPTIRYACQKLDASGRCETDCWPGPSYLGIRARLADGSFGETYGILLKDSPGAVIDQTAVCGANAKYGAAIKITGEAKGTIVRGNIVTAFGGELDSHGIWMEDCGGAAPWIVDNLDINSQGDNDRSRVDGVRAVGTCHPVIDSNVRITGGGEGMAARPNGVYCGANASGKASQCVILGNKLIQGSAGGHPPAATAVRCDDEGCMRIADNTLLGNGGAEVFGLWLQKSGTVVERNRITGGCAAGTSFSTATGVFADDSFARIQNNIISAGTCLQLYSGTNRGLVVRLRAGVNEIDVHSNVIDGAGNDAACFGAAVVYQSLSIAPPGRPAGVFRNNILRAGTCTKAKYGFFESDAAADPRVFENNDLDPFKSPQALYLDENTVPLNTAAAVNGLAVTAASANIAEDPRFASYPTGDFRIMSGSPCIDNGTPTGAPPTDFAGRPRGPKPDIGAHEQ